MLEWTFERKNATIPRISSLSMSPLHISIRFKLSDSKITDERENFVAMIIASLRLRASAITGEGAKIHLVAAVRKVP